VKVLIKVTLAVLLCLVWAGLENAYADHKSVKSPDEHLKSKQKSASKFSKGAKSLPVGREEPAARVTEPPDPAPVK